MHIDPRQWHRERDEFSAAHLRVREPALDRNDSRISIILRAFLSSETRQVRGPKEIRSHTSESMTRSLSAIGRSSASYETSLVRERGN